MGKSTLINLLIPGINLATAEISSTHDTGMHTTTFSEMFDIPGLQNGSRLIDTPGVKGFGTLEFDRHEVGHFSLKYSDTATTVNTITAPTPASLDAPSDKPSKTT